MSHQSTRLRRAWRLGVLSLWCALGPAAAWGATIYVTPAAPGGLPSYSDEPDSPQSEVHMRIARPVFSRSAGPLLIGPRVLDAAVVIDTELRQLVREAAVRHAVPEALLLAVIHVESGFNPRAQSPKGAIGLMQVMPPTGARYGVSSDLYNPVKNIGVGAKYLRYLLDLFRGNTELALAAYNAGEGAVLRHGRAIPPYAETQDYVIRVLNQYARYTQTKG
jgi:soluble lytic murein transglycosylase-like protein